MKFIFVILYLYLVAINVHNTAQSNVNLNRSINKVLDDIAQLTEEATGAIEHQVEKFILDPIKQIETAVKNITTLGTRNDTCVATEYGKVAATVDVFNKSMEVCLVVVRQTSAKIMAEINATGQQLVTAGYNLTRMYQTFHNYPSAIMIQSLYDRIKTKTTSYFENARVTINKLKDITDDGIYYFGVKTDYCTHHITEEAILDLNRISKNIISCITKS